MMVMGINTVIVEFDEIRLELPNAPIVMEHDNNSIEI